MQQSPAPYQQLGRILATGNSAMAITTISKQSGLLPEKIVIPYPGPMSPCDDRTADLNDRMRQAHQQAQPLLFEPNEDQLILIEPHFPEPRLFVFGGGHIAQPLVAFATQAGFATTVLDDRPSFANPDRFPSASQVRCESFENCFSLLDIQPTDFVVIITRGHRHDLTCLRQALNYQTAYTGMIGSRRRIHLAWEQLKDEGFSPSQLSQVFAPIGLNIGAITPVEIAISILGQMIGVKRLGGANSGKNQREENREVLVSLGASSTGPSAVVTVVGAKGSVPRKPGAKMVVRPDGSLIGSIGGGCSESEVLLLALEVIRTRQYRLHQVDMTGVSAEDNGMVCGGLMDVLIEPFG